MGKIEHCTVVSYRARAMQKVCHSPRSGRGKPKTWQSLTKGGVGSSQEVTSHPQKNICDELIWSRKIWSLQLQKTNYCFTISYSKESINFLFPGSCTNLTKVEHLYKYNITIIRWQSQDRSTQKPYKLKIYPCPNHKISHFQYCSAWVTRFGLFDKKSLISMHLEI